MALAPYFTIEENMKGKVAFMTGGTSGIGKATVQVFVQAGVNVVFVGRNAEKGKAIEAELNALGKGEATYMQCDVTDFENLAKCVDAAAEKLGKLNVLYNCAGIFPPQKASTEYSLDEFQWILNTNLVAYFVTIKAALPHLRKTKGVIINTGSVLGWQGDEGACAYTATKGAIQTMTKTIAMDEARYGVRCVEVKPGHINTEMFFQTTSEQADPDGFVAYSDSLQWMNRGGRPEEIGYTVLFLASDWASFITGTDVFVTGGYEIGEGPKPINPFMASNKDENGVDIIPDQRPLKDWIASLNK